MMTGQYVHTHGYYGNSGPIPDKPVWITNWLRRHGYQTAIVGKAHYGYEKVRKEFDFVRLCDRADIDPANPLTNDYFKMLVAPGRQDDHDVPLSQKGGEQRAVPIEVAEVTIARMVDGRLRHRVPSRYGPRRGRRVACCGRTL